ncbi:hypothetical protein RRG08_031557 [Elysia crispata]|uniref:Uncharacterized protein n=1 Tax=Elysia crispata TaxID=231223 RepID=A0AAE1B2V2_9GAST|nr:hypothetical protein RRG08_031557 [Elysia crispata]
MAEESIDWVSRVFPQPAFQDFARILCGIVGQSGDALLEGFPQDRHAGCAVREKPGYLAGVVVEVRTQDIKRLTLAFWVRNDFFNRAISLIQVKLSVCQKDVQISKYCEA